jgi:hypothetical protein
MSTGWGSQTTFPCTDLARSGRQRVGERRQWSGKCGSQICKDRLTSLPWLTRTLWWSLSSSYRRKMILGHSPHPPLGFSACLLSLEECSFFLRKWPFRILVVCSCHGLWLLTAHTHTRTHTHTHARTPTMIVVHTWSLINCFPLYFSIIYHSNVFHCFN